jgi:hypothetical protein
VSVGELLPVLVPGKQLRKNETHFANFLLNFFARSVRWLEEHDGQEVGVTSCGPMDPWFELLATRYPISVLPRVEVAAMLEASDRRLIEPDVPRGDPQRWRRFRASMIDLAEAAGAPQGHVLVLDRVWTDPAYGADGSGAARRTVPNLADIAERLARTHPVDVIDLALLPPAEQVRRVVGAQALVGQHGAGLAHLVLLPDGAGVVEFHSWRNRRRRWFPALAGKSGRPYERILQRHDHARVAPWRVARALERALA